MANMIILDKSYCYNFPKKTIPGDVLALALHLGVFGTGLQPDDPGCPETPLDGQYEHPEQLLLLQLSQKSISGDALAPALHLGV